MKSRRNISNDLKYTKEHFVCENYISDERSILEPIEVKGGESDTGRSGTFHAWIYSFRGDGYIDCRICMPTGG